MNSTDLKMPSRRLLLAGGAGLVAAPFITRGTPALAQSKTLDVLMAPSPVRPELIKLFEEKTGIVVRPAPYVSPTDTMGKLLSGNARFGMMNTLSDLVRPNLEEAVSRGLLLPYDEAKVPNSKHIAPLFQSDMLRKDGQAYSIPVYWGYNAVLYNRKFIRDDEPMIQSYAILFDDKFKGRVAIRDDAHETIHMVALVMGQKNPLDMEKSDLREVTKFLISKKGNFRAVWSKFAEAVQLMASNEVHAMFGWLLMRKTLQQQGMDVVGNHPKEGLLWWVHAGFLPRYAPNPEDSYKWLDFILSADYGRKLTELAGVASPSLLAKNSFTADEQKMHGYDILESGKPMVRLGRPKNFDLWLEAWSEFKAA